MPSPEQKLWSYLSSIMGARWDAQRHEDKYATGVPDVSFGIGGVQGWIELKVVSGWPARSATIISLPTFSPDQRNWLNRRHAKGGHCFILLQVNRTYLLFTGDRAFDNLGRTWTKTDVEVESICHWVGHIFPARLEEVLKWDKSYA